MTLRRRPSSATVPKSTPFATGPSAPCSVHAKRTTSLCASGPNDELEPVAGELRLGGADHRGDPVLALAGHQRVEVAGVLAERLADERAAALRVGLVPGGDVGVVMVFVMAVKLPPPRNRVHYLGRN